MMDRADARAGTNLAIEVLTIEVALRRGPQNDLFDADERVTEELRASNDDVKMSAIGTLHMAAFRLVLQLSRCNGQTPTQIVKELGDFFRNLDSDTDDDGGLTANS